MTRQPCLVVDLDGTLIGTDLLFESLWANLSASWSTIFVLAQAALGGKAALKSELAKHRLDPALLPYREDVLEELRAWRTKGGKTALVTASDQAYADAVAGHIGLFDEVFGSDGKRNLKGTRKATFLEKRFPGGFQYLGDAPSDLPVWERAEEVVTVHASKRLRKRAEQAASAKGKPSRHLAVRADSGLYAGLEPYLKAMRPYQWVKNILIFLPVVADHNVDSLAWQKAVIAFAAFSLVASSAYLLNDLLDLKADRAHPRKRNRPLASGALPLAHGSLMAPGLLVLGFALAALTLSPLFVGVLAFYFALTTVYSIKLKRKLIIDICTLAGLYTVRIFAGGAATDTPLSVWLLAFSIFFFFSLAAVKRQTELVENVDLGSQRVKGRSYRVEDLHFVAMMAIAAGYVAVLVLALYIDAISVQNLYQSPVFLWGVCPVLLYWISRMVMLTQRGLMHDDPIVFAMRDRVSHICGLVILVILIAATFIDAEGLGWIGSS